MSSAGHVKECVISGTVNDELWNNAWKENKISMDHMARLNSNIINIPVCLLLLEGLMIKQTLCAKIGRI